MYIVLFLVFFAALILIIRVLIFRGHKASTHLPVFKSNYCQAICKNDHCSINQIQYNPPDRHNRMFILLHRLSLRSGDVENKALKCPWCGEALNIEPIGTLFKSPPPGRQFAPVPWEKEKC